MDNAPKLDWMYAGPAGHVNTDEYLTGRAVDKTFEQFKLGGAEPLNLDLPAQTLPREKSSVPRIQVDVARKVQEDPLLKIRRQEEERKSMLREQMLIQQRLTSHNRKIVNKPEVPNKRRKGRRSSSESSGDSDLDSKLALKLKQLQKPEKKESLDEKIAKKLQQLKKRKDSTSSSTSSSGNDKSERYRKSRASRHERDRNRDSHYHTKHRSSDDHRQPSLSHGKGKESRRRSRSRSRDGVKNYKDTRPLSRPRAENPTMSSKKNIGMKLSEEELEKRRREMMQNAVVREQERKVKVDSYRKEVEEEAGQLNANRPKEAAFVKKQLANVTANTSVEARIKANVFNIQRSVNSMDSNFARR